MNTEQETKTLKKIYSRADVLCELLKEYKNYNGTFQKQYDIFPKKNKDVNVSNAMIIYKEGIIIRIIKKIRQFFNMKNK